MGYRAFHYKKASPEQAERIDRLYAAFRNLEDTVDELVPPGRANALCITKLEESAMWGARGVVFDDVERINDD